MAASRRRAGAGLRFACLRGSHRAHLRFAAGSDSGLTRGISSHGNTQREGTAALVAPLEEIPFRGAIFGALRRGGSWLAAQAFQQRILCAGPISWGKADPRARLPGIPVSELLPAMVRNFCDVRAVIPGFLNLTLALHHSWPGIPADGQSLFFDRPACRLDFLAEILWPGYPVRSARQYLVVGHGNDDRWPYDAADAACDPAHFAAINHAGAGEIRRMSASNPLKHWLDTGLGFVSILRYVKFAAMSARPSKTDLFVCHAGRGFVSSNHPSADVAACPMRGKSPARFNAGTAATWNFTFVPPVRRC